MVEQLRRLNAGVELMHQGQERQTKALASLGAKLESLLRYMIHCWQEVRGSNPPAA